MKPISHEEGLCLWYVPGRHDQDTIGCLQEVDTQGPSHNQVIKVTTDSLEGATRPSVIRIPGLCDAGVGLPQLLDDGEDPQPISHHLQWISLGQPLLTVEQATRPIARPDHQCGSVVAAVECKPCTTVPLDKIGNKELNMLSMVHIMIMFYLMPCLLLTTNRWIK